MSSLYDPSLALPVVKDSWVPLVSWSAKHREKMDAEISAPLHDRYAAPEHMRYKIRVFLVAEMHRALRSLVTQYHPFATPGLVNVNQLAEPTPTQRAEAKHILDKQPELYRLARKIADVRGFLLFADECDARDGISTRPAIPEGQSSPGLATSSNQRGATTFFPAGLR